MLRPHFEEPLAKVAAHFGICVTLLKKICRRHGIARWPHRQITGLRKSIASMEHAIEYFDGTRRESYALQLQKQKNKLAALLEDPTTHNPLLANEDELATRQVKVPVVKGETPVLMTRASSPTGPLLVESQYYCPSAAPMPTQTPMWYSTAHYAEQYHQLYPLPKLEQTQPEIYPTMNYVPIGVASPAIHLPPLRQETRAVLPPISSLVLGNTLNSSTPASSW
ncbi:RWP-RK domain-containing hypothetical protein [Phytophthora megakarya]|uniref:RWP-RK domain-containing protein n=1 Tax=Phytophthora megakarya TaxID=4795 RepID=A0A225WVB4_9STRA|nr:RWP-RK domain-containing hypothetical protein [Phytophthora megakarya]